MPHGLRVALVLMLIACSRATEAGGSASSNVITQAEIERSGAVNAYEAVQKLRSNFLSDRGRTTIMGRSSSKPVVFLDGVQFGEIQSLRNISAAQVQSIQLYRAWEAQQRYGNGVSGGAIEVTTKK